MKPKILVFASGKKSGGGSGFRNLVLSTMGDNPELDAEIVEVVSNYAYGGVYDIAKEYGIPFFYFPGPYTAEAYQEIFCQTSADWVALSGWLKPVLGIDPRCAFNIHPGPLPRFGGKGMYGHHVHEAVKAAFDRGEITETAVTIHFVTENYDEGPVCFVVKIQLRKGDSAEAIAKQVNTSEHYWQPIVTNLIVHGKVRWDGKDPASLVADVPERLRCYVPI